jgi:hypothetical protein
MGWASGGGIFDPVCEVMQTSHLWPITKKNILVALIEALQMNDWDTEGESLDAFADDPVVVEAFKECGVFLWGTPEYDEAYGENSVQEKLNQEMAETEREPW